MSGENDKIGIRSKKSGRKAGIMRHGCDRAYDGPMFTAYDFRRIINKIAINELRKYLGLAIFLFSEI
jgi:hypothetical protein